MAAYRQSPGALPSLGQRAFPVVSLGLEASGEPIRQSPSQAPVSCDAYECLLAGKTVSWKQILREHPMLGAITVPHLINAGVARAMPDDDPRAGTTDYRLCRADRSRSDNRLPWTAPILETSLTVRRGLGDERHHDLDETERQYGIRAGDHHR